MFVDGYQQNLGEAWFRCLFHLKEGGAKCWPLVDELQERDLCILW